MKVSGDLPVVVLGGGISGLTAARTLHDKGQRFVLLEKCPTFGGLTRTIAVNEFCFDYTGHFLHLSKYLTPEDIPYANLNNEDWVRVFRKSCCYVGGRFVTAPIQYNLRDLAPELLTKCIDSYNCRPALPTNNSSTFREYIVSGFGQELAELFLIPQNEKTMAISLDRLSHRAVRRFFPMPDDALVRKGMAAAEEQEDRAGGYNSQFWYPKTGGIDMLVAGLRCGLTNCVPNQEVAKIDTQRHTVTSSQGSTFNWKAIFSSIPLKLLCRLTSDLELIEASRSLSFSSSICFDIGVHGSLPPEFEGVHWVYVPDRSIPFYRVGFYSNISRGTCTADHSGIYVEVGIPSADLASADVSGYWQRRVLNALETLGWIRSRDIDCAVAHTIPCAYVHHTPERDSAVEFIVSRLRSKNIFPIGRYGLWDYTSMEDSMESARSTVMNSGYAD